MSTSDVCDACWGTGDAERKGVDLRELTNAESKRVAERALTLLADSVGTRLGVLRPALEELCAELDRMARSGRKPRPWHFHEVCEVVAKTLRKGMPGAPVTEGEP